MLNSKIKNKNNRKKILLLILLVLVTIFLIKGLNNKIVVTRYDIVDPKVKDEFKLLFISDTHSCRFGQNQKDLLDKVKLEKPDLILLGGDIIDDELPMEIGFETIKDLYKLCPVFYVTGNHEIRTRQEDFIKEKIKSFNIDVLEGSKRDISIHGNKISIFGLNDPTIGDNYYKELDQIKNIKSENLSILLAHRPERIQDYKELDVDYVFSGHAHGGQWRIPYILESGLLAPNQGFFPKYTKGVNEVGNFKLIISRGLSIESTRIPRFFNPPEFLVVKFKGN